MSNWAIVFPTGTTNYAQNPSPRDNLNGYGKLISGTISRSTDYQFRGLYSVKVLPTSVGPYDGLQFTGSASIATFPYSVSFDALFPFGQVFKAAVYHPTGSHLSNFAQLIITGSGLQERYSFQITGTTYATPYISIGKNNHAGTSAFYIDGLQIESGPVTTYCDGEQEDCYWSGQKNNSYSIRAGTTNLGGIELDLETDLGFKVTRQFGIGMPIVQNNSIAYTIRPGSFYQNTSVKERILDIVGIFKGSSVINLHSLRKTLLGIIQPTDSKTRIWKYKGATRQVELEMIYDSGLNFGEPNQYLEKTNVRLIGFNQPYWKEEYIQGTTLVQNTTGTAYYLNRRLSEDLTTAIWQGVSNGPSGFIYALAQAGPGKHIYFGGSFTGTAGNPNSKGIGRLTSITSLTAEVFSTGTNTDANVLKFVVMPDDDLVALGDFSNMGGVPNTSCIGRYDFDLNNWTSLANGSTVGILNAGCLDSSGNLIVGGTVTNIGGVAVTSIAKRDSAGTWTALGNPSGTVHSLALGPDGYVYAGVQNVGLRRYVNSAWETVGTIRSGTTIKAIEFDTNGNCYAGGSFDTIGGVATPFLGMFNGYTWTKVGNTGLGTYPTDSGVLDLKWDKVRNILYIAGDISTADTFTIRHGLVYWNGSSFVFPDIQFSLDDIGCYAVLVDNLNQLTASIKVDGVYKAYGPLIQTVNNRSTAPTYPIFQFSVPSTGTATALYQIANQDTKDTIYFNITIQPGETLTLDLRPNKNTFISSLRGNVYNTILPGSQKNTLTLRPGTNRLAMYADYHGGLINTTVLWDVTHLSADGGV